MAIGRRLIRWHAWAFAVTLAFGCTIGAAPAVAQPEGLTRIDLSKARKAPAKLEGVAAEAARAEWWSNLEACEETNRPACDRAVALAKNLYERTDRNVATTWMKACLAGDQDRCEIGFRRFRATSFPDDDKPISHLFARASCIQGMYDLCRPWDDFETANADERALVMAKVCLQGASMNTCNQALAHFRHHSGLFSQVTNDLAVQMCNRNSTSACRVYAESVEAHWDPDRAYKLHKQICERGMQESCVDAKRLKRGVDYRARKKQAALEAELRRQAAVERAKSYRFQLSQRGYAYNSTPSYKKEATPFGSSMRDRENWRRYQYNVCRSSPVNKHC